MKAIDTNVLIRYIMNDDSIQNQKVGLLFEQALIQNKHFFVSMLVVLEIDWVLSSVFNLKRADIIEILLDLLALKVLKFEYADILKDTLHFAQTNSYDLSDLLIGYIAKHHNYTTTLTFDKKAAKSTVFELII